MVGLRGEVPLVPPYFEKADDPGGHRAAVRLQFIGMCIQSWS